MDSIASYAHDAPSNIFRVTRRVTIGHKGVATSESIVTDYHYSLNLKTLDSVTTTRNTNSIVERLEHDNYGNETKSTDANGFYTEYIYDDTYHAFVVETRRQVAIDTVMTIGKAAYYWRAGVPDMDFRPQ